MENNVNFLNVRLNRVITQQQKLLDLLEKIQNDIKYLKLKIEEYEDNTDFINILKDNVDTTL